MATEFMQPVKYLSEHLNYIEDDGKIIVMTGDYYVFKCNNLTEAETFAKGYEHAIDDYEFIK